MIEAQVLEVRKHHKAWGGRKIRRVLQNQGNQLVPAASTITAILHRHEQIDLDEPQKHKPMRLFELQRYYSWIVDRFHISTRAYQLQAHGEDYDFRWLEERLLPLNFRLVLLHRTPDSFVEARAERLKVSGNPDQYNDLKVFVREQELVKKMVGESILPWLELDISDNDIPHAVEKIADWMESTGGLWME